MRALCQSTWCRFVLLLTLAAFVAAGAAIPVGATDTVLTNYIGYDHIYKDSQGVIILSKSNLKVIPLRVGSKMTSLDQSTMLGFTSVDKEPLLIFIPESYSDKITYKLYIAETSVSLQYNQNNEVITDQVTSNVGSLTGSYTASYFNAYFIFYYGMWGMTGSQFLQSYTYTSNNIVYDTTNNTVSGNIQNPTINPNYTLDDAIGSSGLSTDDLINAIDTALKNNEILLSINENLDIILNYGSNYNQIDQTIINNLGTAQDNLSSAEGALQDKSQSLRDGVSSQWQNNINTTKNFVSTITPATTAITSTITQVVAVMPEEVQALLVVIPLLLFIGWLIGRIEGG